MSNGNSPTEEQLVKLQAEVQRIRESERTEQEEDSD